MLANYSGLTPVEYKPEFQEDVIVTFPTGATSQVNPKYCLLSKSAYELAAMLETSSDWLKTLGIKVLVGNGWPGPQDIPFRIAVQSRKVPWLCFLDAPEQKAGTRINAGILAACFTHGYPPAYALRLVEAEYKGNAYDQGFGGLPGAF